MNLPPTREGKDNSMDPDYICKPDELECRKHIIIGILQDAVCPWPESIWPMTDDEYVKAVPDPILRTAISGYLMRCGWELFRKAAIEEIEDLNEEIDGL